MSVHDALEAECTDCSSDVELLIRPREKDLGEFTVRRVLPAAKRRLVGPFIFFDHMGPAVFPPGKGIAVRPHPHIGLATITYLFEGSILHRDSLGYVQPIEPGAVNFMTAGRGITHSERDNDDLDQTVALHGIQSWMALPASDVECEPSFEHYPAEQIPTVALDKAAVTVIIGSAYGVSSPVATSATMLYLDARLDAGATLALPNSDELAFYVVDGNVRCGEQEVARGEMAVLRADAQARVETTEPAHIMVIGGEPMGERKIFWNFVALDAERIEQAKVDWAEGRFDPVPGDEEFIPLPS